MEMQPKKKKGKGCLIAIGVVFGIAILVGVLSNIGTKMVTEKTADGKTKISAKAPTATPVSEEYKEKMKREQEDKDYLLSLENRREELEKKLRKSVDDVENNTWYYDETTPEKFSNGVFLYFGGSGDEIHDYIRAVYRYKGRSWIFFKQVIFNIDGEVYKINLTTQEYMNKWTDAWGGRVGEKFDTAVYEDHTILELAKLLPYAKDVKVRFKGDDFIDDYEMGKKEKQAFRDVIETYQAMKGKVLINYDRIDAEIAAAVEAEKEAESKE